VKAVVACLGASATEAVGSYDWIRDLTQRPGNAAWRFYRFAEGGDLAYNGLGRLPDVINCHPDYVIVLLGDNDVLALLSKKHYQFVRLTKHLPGQPSPEWYRETMQTIVRRLKSETKVAIALCSLIPIGEDPGSSNPFQAEANRLIEEYSVILKDIAREEAVSYLPSMSGCTNSSSRPLAAPSPASTFCRSIAMRSGNLSCTRAMMR
jgi:lysophospholipase L1-like esterase